jgi:FkbM family methyltransferase
MPHRTTETLMRLRALEAALARPAPPAAVAVPELHVYPGYTAADLALFDRFAAPRAAPTPGFITDFLGVRTATRFVSAVAGLDGTTIDPPTRGGDWHGETAEWVGLLKSALAGRGPFNAMELGAGWGPWLVAGAAAARRLGRPVGRLVAVEADPGHYAFLRAHLAENGLDPAGALLVQAAVGAAAGRARWPRVADPAADWGSRPVTDAATQDHLGRAVEADWLDVEIVPIVPLLEAEPHWDLVHVDVQGMEAELIEAAADTLDARARYLIVGTHSAVLHGRIMATLFAGGWMLENEKPPRFTWTQGAPSLEAMTQVDGTQVWRNTRLA